MNRCWLNTLYNMSCDANSPYERSTSVPAHYCVQQVHIRESCKIVQHRSSNLSLLSFRNIPASCFALTTVTRQCCFTGISGIQGKVHVTRGFIECSFRGWTKHPTHKWCSGEGRDHKCEVWRRGLGGSSARCHGFTVFCAEQRTRSRGWPWANTSLK